MSEPCYPEGFGSEDLGKTVCIWSTTRHCRLTTQLPHHRATCLYIERHNYTARTCVVLAYLVVRKKSYGGNRVKIGGKIGPRVKIGDKIGRWVKIGNKIGSCKTPDQDVVVRKVTRLRRLDADLDQEVKIGPISRGHLQISAA